MIVDLLETYDGDLFVVGGDLADTEQNEFLPYYQIIRTLVTTMPGDFLVYPLHGVNLRQYLGLPNTKATADKIVDIIKNAISQYTTIYSSTVSIDAFPVGRHTIAIRIKLLGDSEGIILTYDTADEYVKSSVIENDLNQETVVVNIPPTKQGL